MSQAAHEEQNRKAQMMFIGGVATQRGMVEALEHRLGITVEVPNDCEYVCALGAALLGLKRLQSRNGNPLEVRTFQANRGERLPLTA